ncbi:amidohydrolase family protein, partial [Chloroflexota bacterium]
GEPIQNAVIVIEGERIKEVGSEGKVSVPAGAEVIDMGECTLTPGLIDAHMQASIRRFCRNQSTARFLVPPQLQEFYALLHFQICFESGITMVRECGTRTMYGVASTAENVGIRNAINIGLVPGPRVLVGGFCLPTNSHLSEPYSYFQVSPELTADGADEMRKLARRQLRMQADFLKACASGGGGTDKDSPEEINGTVEELTVIAEEAHRSGRYCACHCHNAEAEKMAVRAGFDTIEHCVFTDDEAIAMIRDANKLVTPTLAHRTDEAIEEAARGGATEFTIAKQRRIQSFCYETFRKMHEAGVRLAMGTDVGVDAGTHEIELYVKLGMTPMEALQSATKVAAEACWLGNETGTLDVGKYADIVAVNGDPLQDIKVYQDRENIRLVMKEGMVYIDKRPGHERYVIHNWNWKVV